MTDRQIKLIIDVAGYASKKEGVEGMMETVPNKPKTPLRNVRIDDELWDAAKVAAAANDETVSEVIRRSLQDYVTGDER